MIYLQDQKGGIMTTLAMKARNSLTSLNLNDTEGVSVYRGFAFSKNPDLELFMSEQEIDDYYAASSARVSEMLQSGN